MANRAVGKRAVGQLDGRTVRKDRNRTAVLDAVIELYRDGNLSPSPEQAAARAGVSLRSVYRYFPDPSGLLTAALMRDFERAGSSLDCGSGVKGDLHARIDAFVDTRLRLYQAFAPSCRVAQLHASGNPELAGVLRYARDLVGDHIRTFFAPELKRMPPATADAVLLALGAIFQLESLDEYTLGRGLSLEAVRRQTTEACTRILGRRPRVTAPAPTLDLTEASVGGHAEDSALDRHR